MTVDEVVEQVGKVAEGVVAIAVEQAQANEGSDEDFFVRLNERLHYTTKLTGRLRGYAHQYHDAKMTRAEFDRMVGLLNVDAERDPTDYAIMPVNTNWGLSPGFLVVLIGPNAKGTALKPFERLSFIEKQMPPGITWDDMADIYTGAQNVALLKSIGWDKAPSRDRWEYDY
ncbi:TPA: hypothetical protein HA265_07125 [Candidatus Woesearchaeota archaeon]|nr:hypothetical protein [Candidatus Woesearchaeota archaeon]